MSLKLSNDRQYYCLVASLEQWGLDSDVARIDFGAIRAHIAEQLSDVDKEAIELLYSYYDVENLLAALRGSDLQHNSLGNLSHEQILAEIEAAGSDDEPFVSQLSPSLRFALDYYQGRIERDEDDEQTQTDIERSLLENFYRQCDVSKCNFLRDWAAADRSIRNVVAGSDAAIGALDEDVAEQTWYTPLKEVLATDDFVEREHKMDALRWNLAEDLAVGHDFDIACLMSYLIHLNILERWALLSKDRGRERFGKIVNSFTSKLKI